MKVYLTKSRERNKMFLWNRQPLWCPLELDFIGSDALELELDEEDYSWDMIPDGHPWEVDMLAILKAAISGKLKANMILSEGRR